LWVGFGDWSSKYKEVAIIKFETIIKSNYTLDPEQIEEFNTLSMFHKRQFISMAKENLRKLIQEQLESDQIEISIKVYE
jgi:hypothetical protein